MKNKGFPGLFVTDSELARHPLPWARGPAQTQSWQGQQSLPEGQGEGGGGGRGAGIGRVEVDQV